VALICFGTNLLGSLAPSRPEYTHTHTHTHVRARARARYDAAGPFFKRRTADLFRHERAAPQPRANPREIRSAYSCILFVRSRNARNRVCIGEKSRRRLLSPVYAITPHLHLAFYLITSAVTMIRPSDRVSRDEIGHVVVAANEDPRAREREAVAGVSGPWRMRAEMEGI